MAIIKSTGNDLLQEIAELRARLEESEETLRAIRYGEVDALLVSGPEGDRVFTLKGADHSYRILVETINEGAATLASDGRIIYANRKLAAMLEAPLERLIGSSINDYVAPGDGEFFEALLHQGRQGDSKGELHLQTTAGAEVPAYISFSSMQLEALPDTVCLAVTDLTKQKRQEEILASGRLFQNVLEQAEHVIIVCDANESITQASRAAHELAAKNLLLMKFDEAFPLTYKSTGSFVTTSFSLQKVLTGRIYRGIEAGFRREDGKEFHLLLNGGPLYGHNSAIVGAVVTLTDITFRKQAEEALHKYQEELEQRVQERTVDLRRTVEQLELEMEERLRAETALQASQRKLRYLAAQLIDSQETERNRIALELHDDLGQSLIALAMQLRDIARAVPVDHTNIKDRCNLASDYVYEIIENVRRLSRDLRPSLLEDLGLTIALKHLAETFTSYQGINIALDMDDTKGLFAPQEEINIFRIFQESLTNIAKYARATDVSFTVRKMDGVIYFQVEDNGAGFDTGRNMAREASRKGLGLAAMEERVRMMGGSLEIWSQEGKGTRISFKVPLRTLFKGST